MVVPTKPMILVPGRSMERVVDDSVGVVDREITCLMSTYVSALTKNGAIPLLVPVPPADLTEDETRSFLKTYCDMFANRSATGLLLTGGPDLSPKLYGEPNKFCQGVNDRVDALDIALIRAALEFDCPIFAICRGMQLVNVVLGGSCWQHMDAELMAIHERHEVDRTVISHQCPVAPTARFRQLFDDPSLTTIEMNSLHHQCLKDIGQGLVVVGAVGIEEDNNSRNDLPALDYQKPSRGSGPVVELIEHESKWVFGTQCHPEELFGTSKHWSAVFKAFVNAARAKSF